MQAAQMARTAALVTALGILQKVAGFLRELAIARAFGATNITDAYVVGLTVADVTGNVASASLAGALVPPVTAAAGSVPGRAERITRAAVRRVGLVAAAAAALGVAAAPWYLEPVLAGWAPDLRALAVACARIALPGAALAAVGAVLRAYLYARGIFTITPLGGLTINLSIMAAALLLPGLGPLPLAGAHAAGNAFYLLLYAATVGWVLRRHGLAAPGRAAAATPAAPVAATGAAPAAGALLLPLVAWSLAGQATAVVERLFASALAPGAIAALNFAERLRQFPLQTAMQAVAVVSYPALAAAAAARDDAHLREVLGRGLRLALLLALPMALGLLTLRAPIVRLVYERGAFDAAATAVTADILAGYAVSIVGLAAAMLCAYAFFSLGRPWVPVGAVLAGVAVQAAGGWLLVGRLGPVALAWSGAAGALLNAAVQLGVLHRRLGGAAGAGWLGGWQRPAVAAGTMALGCLAVAPTLGALPGRAAHGAATLAAVAAAALLYAGLLWRLGVPEAVSLAGWLRRRRDAAGSGRFLP